MNDPPVNSRRPEGAPSPAREGGRGSRRVLYGPGASWAHRLPLFEYHPYAAPAESFLRYQAAPLHPELHVADEGVGAVVELDRVPVQLNAVAR